MVKYDVVWRVIENSQCNDFNNEPEYRIVAYDIDYKNNRMRQRGFSNWHKIIDDYFLTKDKAEKYLEENK